MSKMMRAVLSMAAAFATLAPVCADPLPQYSFTAIGAFRGTDLNNNGQVAGVPDGGGGLVWSPASTRPLNGAGYVYSINDSGQAAGDAGDIAAVWDDQGVRTTIGGQFSTALRINNSGQVLLVDFLNGKSYRKTGSDLQSLTDPDDQVSEVRGMNNLGEVVGGSSFDLPVVWGSTSARASLLPNGTDPSGSAESIGDGGQIAGFAGDGQGSVLPVRWVRDGSGGYTRQLLPLLESGSFFIEKMRINANGDIVASLVYEINGSQKVRSILWTAGGAAVDLGAIAAAQGYSEFYVEDINDSGWILANTVLGQSFQALLLKPVVVPEPGFYLSLALGLGGLFVARRRRGVVSKDSRKA
jgi:hypothetical protein